MRKLPAPYSLYMGRGKARTVKIVVTPEVAQAAGEELLCAAQEKYPHGFVLSGVPHSGKSSYGIKLAEPVLHVVEPD